MRIGVPKEIKNSERRVALTPAGASALVSRGHEVFVAYEAGEGSGFSNTDYDHAGAHACASQHVWAESELIVKVKEPLHEEWRRIQKRQVIFTYFHLAADYALTEAMLKSDATCIAYETVQLASGELPLLTPMSQVAGYVAIREGAHYLDLLLNRMLDVPQASVVIIGGGTAGISAATAAAQLGANVTVLDTSPSRLGYIKNMGFNAVPSTRETILEHIAHADLLIGAVLVPGAKAPKIIRKRDLGLMRKGSVIVDIAIDQGGCVETIRPTTHENPVYEVDGIIHYGVTNMPGAVPRTSTRALTNATLPYITAIADKGCDWALIDDEALRKGLNICDGHVTHRGVADAFGLPYVEPEKFL